MPPKSRHRNRGSRSFFANELLRSIARGRSQPAVGIPASGSDLRSQSSLSCDPYAQDGPVNSRMEGPHHILSASATISTTTSYHSTSRGNVAGLPGTASNGFHRHWKKRRLSWLPTSWSKASRDGNHASLMSMPPTASMSSISRSSISSPVLTRTSNARVASTAKVDHSEILFPISSPTVVPSQGNTTHKSEEASGRHNASNASSWASSVKDVRSKLGHSRRASTGVLLTASWSRRRQENREHVDAQSVSGPQRGKMATYRGKLHHLGKRLHVLAVDSRDDVVSSEVVKAKEIRSHQLDKASRTPTPRATLFLPGPHADSTTDLLRGSLSKSFASAVDKLDLDSSPTLVQYSPSMSALRKAKSMVGMFGKHQDPDKNSTKSKDNPPPVPTVRSSKLYKHENKALKFNGNTSRTVSHTQPDEEVAASGPIGRNHPDPLRSHPNVTSFAFPGGQSQKPVTPSPRMPSSTAIQGAVDSNDDDIHSLNTAPIYSPSVGDISQYTRTPTPSVKKPEPGVINTRVPQETPTKQPTYKKLKKSVSGFFTKSASKIKFTATTPDRQANIAEENAQEPAGTTDAPPPERATHDHQPVTPSPLRNISRPDVSEIGEERLSQAVTLSMPTGLPAEAISLRTPRSPQSIENREKRRAMYGQQAFDDLEG